MGNEHIISPCAADFSSRAGQNNEWYYFWPLAAARIGYIPTRGDFLIAARLERAAAHCFNYGSQEEGRTAVSLQATGLSI